MHGYAIISTKNQKQTKYTRGKFAAIRVVSRSPRVSDIGDRKTVSSLPVFAGRVLEAPLRITKSAVRRENTVSGRTAGSIQLESNSLLRSFGNDSFLKRRLSRHRTTTAHRNKITNIFFYYNVYGGDFRKPGHTGSSAMSL